MTRVLVLGNSHAATLRRAFPAIAAAYPDLRLSFWGLPGAAFAKAMIGPDGMLRPDPSDRQSLRKADQWNDADHIDLTTFDRIFLVGLRYNQRHVLTLMRRLQPLDWGKRTGALGVSEGFLRAAVRAEIDSSLTAQNERVPMDARFTLMPAPFPAEAVTQSRSDLYEPVTSSAAALRHAADLMALHDEELTAAHATLGLGFALQPPQTRARPFLTYDEYLEDPDRDARHMNADYGLIAFEALLAAARPLSTSAPQASGAADHATA